jgi:hypothetical protein
VIAAAVGAGVAYLVHRETLRRGPRE